MKNYTPFEKLSKKQKKAINNEKRNTWGDLSPVTRIKKNEKIYNRKKARGFDFESDSAFFTLIFFSSYTSIQ